MTPTYKAAPCPCGSKVCTAWHVSPPADVQGVSFRRDQAEAVAQLLNDMDAGKTALLYKALIEYMDRGTARTWSIIFEAVDPAAARAGVVAWWANRQAAIPEAFGPMLAVKLHPWKPQRFRDDGYLPADTGLFCWEWKYDWGMPLAHWVEHG